MATKAAATRDHDEIRRWVEEHGGIPTKVKGTDGLLRIDFVKGSKSGGREPTLEEISWDEWFRLFDQQNLVFLHGTGDSKFFKLVYPETLEQKQRRKGAARGRATTGRPAQAGGSRRGASASRRGSTASRPASSGRRAVASKGRSSGGSRGRSAGSASRSSGRSRANGGARADGRGGTNGSSRAASSRGGRKSSGSRSSSRGTSRSGSSGRSGSSRGSASRSSRKQSARPMGDGSAEAGALH